MVTIQMSKPRIEKLNALMRIQLSESFFLRDFIYSEIAAEMGLNNIPTDVDLAVKAGRQLCENVLEPIQAVWGRIHIRSALRSETVNRLGNDLQAACARNETSYAGHIWDRRDKNGYMGAMACIVIPRYVPYYTKTGDWTSIAWWIHAHIPAYRSLFFFPQLCAFNIHWHEDQTQPKYISSYIDDPNTGHRKSILLKDQVSDYYAKIPLERRYQACQVILQSQGHAQR